MGSNGAMDGRRHLPLAGAEVSKSGTMPARPRMRPRAAPAQFHVLGKPTGAVCNLDCKYCFFLSKEALYPGSDFRMSDDVLEAYIAQTIESQTGSHVTIAWQGGEPTLMGLDFFRRAVELVAKHRRRGMTIEHTIQTNGVLLDDRWCEFFRENRFLVGLSMDGPRRLHDAYRLDRGGHGTFDRVHRAAVRLREHDVDVNILCTVHAANAEHPLEVYRFFRDELGAQFIQLIAVVERCTPELRDLANDGWGTRKEGRPFYAQEGSLVTDRSVRPVQWGAFLQAIFDEWLQKDVGRVFVQLFESTLAAFMGLPPSLCIFAETCGDALALEHNGDLYSCDHFVEPDHRLGNITEQHMVELVASEQQRAFGRAKRDTLPRACRECDVLFACHGECPRNRFAFAPDGEAGLNYLCAGYKAFFHHVDRPMRVLGHLVRTGSDPAAAWGIVHAEREGGRPKNDKKKKRPAKRRARKKIE